MMNYDLLYADLKGMLGTDRVDASAHLRLQKTKEGDSEKGFFAMMLPVFTGSAELVYNWNRRVFAGVRAKGQTGRPSTVWDDKGFLDLVAESDHLVDDAVIMIWKMTK